MELIRIDHVSLDFPDRARSIRWYAEVLDLPVPDDSGTPHDEPVFLGPDRAALGLFQEPGPAALRHIAFATDAAGQRALIERLERLGVPYRSERHSTSDSIYFTDPDGITLEILVPTPE